MSSNITVVGNVTRSCRPVNISSGSIYLQNRVVRALR